MIWEMWGTFSSNQTDAAIWKNWFHWEGGKGWGRWAWAISPRLALLWPHIPSIASYCVHIMFISCIFISQGDVRAVPLCKLENNDFKLLRPSVSKSPQLNKVDPGDEMSHEDRCICGCGHTGHLIYTITNSLLFHVGHCNCSKFILNWMYCFLLQVVALLVISPY